jgi:CelD/BcsL family acetyltransferase involved in cellulose biosynthesis
MATSTPAFFVVVDSADFHSLREAWNALWSNLDNPHVFSSFEWCWNAWTLVAQRRGCTLRIVCGRLDARLVLIWPMMEDGRVLRMLSSETLEYRDIIVERSELASCWIEGAWSHLLATTRATTFFFQNLRQPNALRTRLAQIRSARPTGGGWCPLIRLDRFADWDAYAGTLSKSLMSDQRRQWKRLRQTLPEVSFRVIDRADAIEPMMDWIRRHKVVWGQSRGTPTVWFNDDDIHAMLKAVARSASADGRYVLAALSDGNTTISAGWGYVCGSEFLFHAFAYDNAYATFSPSRLFLERLLQYCFQRELRSFDFMPGKEAYKRIWATDYVRQESFIGALNWRGDLLLHLSRLRTSEAPLVARRLYRLLPARWRSAIDRSLRTYRLVHYALGLKSVARPAPVER